MKKIAIIIALLSFTILPLFAVNHDGKWLLNGLIITSAVKNYPASGPAQDDNTYIGYIMGIAEMDMILEIADLDGVSYKETISVVEEFLKNNPLLLDKEANLLVSKALSDKWPGKLMKPEPFTPPPIQGRDGT